MTVQEAVMATGQWDLKLLDGTPSDITDRLQDWYSILRVFSARVDPDVVSSLAPFYSGVLLRNDSQYEIGGAGPAWWLGEPNLSGDQVGPLWDNVTGPLAFTNGTLTQWVHGIADQADLGYGTIGASATTWTGSLGNMAPRVALDPWLLAAYDSHEWRVGPSLNLSVGTAPELYRTPGGGDISVVVSKTDLDSATTPEGLLASELNVGLNVEDLLHRVVLARSGGTDGITDGGTWNYKGPGGNALRRTRYTVNTDVSAGDANGYINRILNRYKSVEKAIQISLAEYALSHPFKVGDWIWIQDTDRGLYSVSNALDFAGTTVYPTAVRCFEMTWPFTEGLGVYLQDPSNSNRVTDLTDWIQWEGGDTTLTLGAYPKRLNFLNRPAT